MREITVPVPGVEYPIRIAPGLLDSLGEQLRERGLRGSLALVQDSGVADTYGVRARQALEQADYQVTPLVVPAGEASKSLACLGTLWDAFAGAALDRGSAVVALGGGMVGDLAGFAAATYLRGIAFVQIPTTLLAQVDASVGGKTAIDLEAGKNLVGAFHQPRLVLIDLDTLNTLPDREFRAGLAEVIKYGVIWDAEFFRYLEANRTAILHHQPDVLAELIARCCEIKAEVVGQDERESGLRAILNYGHTIGHAVESVAGYGAYLHGEAIAIGMVAAGWLSERMSGFSSAQADAVRHLITEYGLPTRAEAALPEEALMAAMIRDKKSRGGELRFVLARSIGEVEMCPVPAELAQDALREVVPGRM